MTQGQSAVAALVCAVWLSPASCTTPDDPAIAGAIDVTHEGETCTPRTCDGPIDHCGAMSDGCGGTLACGGCEAPLSCGARAPNVCGIAEAARVCNQSGWCWENPLPFGMDLTAAWGASANDVWATGLGGTLLRFNGTAWRAVNAGTDSDLSTVWGTAANNVYIGGDDGYLRRWNGALLARPLGAPSTLDILDIHGSGPQNVWIAGQWGDFDYYRFDGLTFRGFDDPNFFSPETVLALSATQVYSFGFSDTRAMWNGSQWSSLTSGPETSYDSWASGPSDLWVASRQGVIRKSGTTWSTSLAPGGEVLAIHGSSASNVWAGSETGLHRWNGSDWLTHATDAPIQGLWVADANTAWAVGQSGRVLAWNGSQWTKHSGVGATYSFEAAWPVSATEIWFVGQGAMRWKDGVLEDHGPLFDIEWYDDADIWGASADDIWVAGPSGRLAHWDGTGWSLTVIPELDASFTAITSIWGTSSDNIYAVTEATDSFEPSDAYVLRYDGSTWSIVQTIRKGTDWGVDLLAVGGTGPNDVWVSGGEATLFHWNGSQWADLSSSGLSAKTFWASPQGTLWAGTAAGVFRKTGTTFVKVAGLDSVVESIHGTSDQDVWVTASDGSFDSWPMVARWNGTAWARENTGAGQSLREVLVTPSTLWAAGRSGGILRKTR